jgi:hypothetical protein
MVWSRKISEETAKSGKAFQSAGKQWERPPMKGVFLIGRAAADVTGKVRQKQDAPKN